MLLNAVLITAATIALGQVEQDIPVLMPGWENNAQTQAAPPDQSPVRTDHTRPINLPSSLAGIVAAATVALILLWMRRNVDDY
jgi:hypothetical protein